MKTPLRSGLALSAACILLFSACALGFEPAWKGKSDKAVIAFRLAVPELPASSTYARAIAQGGGYIYIRTLGGPSSSTPYYGPYRVGAGELFETTDLPPGTYDGIGVLYSPESLETKSIGYGGVATPFATLMQLSDADFNAFSSNGDTSLFNEMLNGDASGFMIKNVTLKTGEVNSFKLTMQPMTGPATTVDTSVLPTVNLASPAPASLVRKFIKIKNVNPTLGYTITNLVATVSATGSPTLGTGALYDQQGQLLQAFPVPATNPIASAAVYSVPYTMGDHFFYIEYQTTDLAIAFSKVETPITYTVNFDSQGATTPPAPVIKTVTSPATTVVTMPTAPLRTGFVFNGWFTAPNGGGSPFSGATPVTADITVYASWTANSFLVIFDPNMGTGSMAPLPIDEGITASLTVNSFTKPGYTFEGWGIAAGGPVVYADGVSYTMGASSVTLYAQWTANSYLVSYDAQGGTPNPAPYSATYGLGYMTPMPATRPGFTFGGWWTAPMGGGIEVIGGTIVTTPSDHTLFAKWTPWTKLQGSFGMATTTNGLATDSGGNNFVTGIALGTLNGQPLTGIQDAFVSKIDSAGISVWTRMSGVSSQNTAGSDVAVDASGNIYVTGFTTGNLDSVTLSGMVDAFVIKYDSAGTKLWTRLTGLMGMTTKGSGIAVDTSGNVYITGYTNGSIDSQALTGVNDVFVIKYDSAGTKQWTKLSGLVGLDARGTRIVVDSSGNTYVTGYSPGSFGGETSLGSYINAFIIKYDMLGAKLFTRLLTSASGDIKGYDIALDGGGNIIVTGSAGAILDSQPKTGTIDVFVAKYAPDGTKGWTKLSGVGSAITEGFGVAIDSIDVIHATGYTNGALDGQTLTGVNDLFVIKYDSASGTKQPTSLLGVAGASTKAVDIDISAGGTKFIAGSTTGALELQTMTGAQDLFVTTKVNP